MSIEGFRPGTGAAGQPAILAIILHGWGSTAQAMGDVAEATREAWKDTHCVDTFVPLLAYHRQLRSARAVDVVAKILKDIDELVQIKSPYERIILIGHSLGATIARRVFLVASGSPPGFATEKTFQHQQKREWADKVHRIVLLAAFNRGWQISPRLSWWYSIGFNICGLIGHVLPRWAPTIFDIRLGAPFMAQTRLHWLAYRRQQLAAGLQQETSQAVGPAAASHEPILIQLIGSTDDLISPFDQVDIVVDGNAGGNPSYFLIKLDKTDHHSAIRFTATDGDQAAAEARKGRFLVALTGTKRDLTNIATDPSLLIDEVDKPDHKVKDTVFVIHGIRDDGFWTHRVAEKVREQNKPATVFRAWTPTYGYFAMLPFILPWIRRQKVEWFMDQYVGAVAQYPNSSFHYVGHSNGTYLAARALIDYPACTFRNVLFAGSVVRTDYDWKTPIGQRRVERFLNIVASKDWVVALLPKSLEGFRCFDLGGAGFDGFKQAKYDAPPEIAERKYVEGSHGAGIAEAQWDNIANFIVGGQIPPDNAAGFVKKQLGWLKALSSTRATLWVLAAIVILVVPALVLSSSLSIWACITILLVYALVVKFVITRL
ncbi:alpha/beta fold hydrolase [Mesorhizobium loti]|uniref:Alpha/beta hydrolase n=1 Tax=Mesorhizobium loti R88b TaxID=935548 RepID=A0A6M7WPZ5_RHILI|nr:alpha/beta fold hydrolase [Mesorhizobium loti]QKD02649.1 alpha/beta hydrolase [Mesorhizobium loti R88b]